MKTSKKLLILSACLVIALLVTGLLTLRNDVRTMVKKSESETTRKILSADNFEKLDFTGGWNVTIRQGKEYKVEIEEQEWSESHMENKNNTLYFTGGDFGNIRANVTMPSLKKIKVTGSSKIRLENFRSDTLWVSLTGNSALTGSGNEFGYVSFKTSGESKIELTGTGDK